MGAVSEPLIQWFELNRRLLPFRQEPSAYHIWVSEIMLQQTRVSAALPYYERFVAELPDPAALAACDPDKLRKLWQGLGYYSRARLLQKAARAIVSQYGGELPADLQKLRALPGVGDYTSGAIASIAFGIPAAAVDGNVERVICRYFAISEEMGSPKSRRMIHELAQSLVPPDRPGAFANAMMEMGATMCTPKSPSCLLCPVRAGCKGYAQGMAERLPVKPKKKAQRVEKRCVMLVFCQNRVLTVLRRERLLGGLSVFPDAVGALSPAQMCAALEALGVPAVYDARLGCAKHVFTHLIWEMEIHAFAADAPTDVPDGRWVNAAELAALPMPTAVKAARKFAEAALKA